MKKIKFNWLLGLLTLFLFVSCTDTRDGYDFPQKKKRSYAHEVGVDLTIGVSTSRSFSSARSMTIGTVTSSQGAQHSVAALEWSSDSWNNSDNKPILLVSLINNGTSELQLVPVSDYTYIKATGSSSPMVKIKTKIRYNEDPEDIVFYLLDKTNGYDLDNGTITFDQTKGSTSRIILKPLSDKESNKINPIFKSSLTNNTNLTVSRLSQNDNTINLRFNPVGTFVLFDVINRRDQAFNIPVTGLSLDLETSSLVINGLISTATGRLKQDVAYLPVKNISYALMPENGAQLSLASGAKSSLYGIWVLGAVSEANNGSLTFVNRDVDVFVDHIYHSLGNFGERFGGKSVYIPIQSVNENAVPFVTEWMTDANGTITFYYEKDASSWFSYQKEGTTTWTRVSDNNVTTGTYSYNRRSFPKYTLSGFDPNTTYKIRVYGATQMKLSSFNGDESNPYVKKIVQWGISHWQYLGGMAVNCTNLDLVATDRPDLSYVDANGKGLNLGHMFRGCTNFRAENGVLSTWNTSNILYTYSMFSGCTNFNQPLNDWDMSACVDIANMFNGATIFNQPLDKWSNLGTKSKAFTDVIRKVEKAFANSAFDQNISSWRLYNDVGNRDNSTGWKGLVNPTNIFGDRNTAEQCPAGNHPEYYPTPL